MTTAMLALALGLVLGAGVAVLVLRSRAAAAAAELQTQAAAAQAVQAALGERLRGCEERLAAQASDLDAARGEASALRDELRGETGRRAKAEEAAGRVPGLEARVADQARALAEAQARESELTARMEEARKAAVERESLLRDLQAQLQNTFKALSADALNNNNQNFLQLAAQHLARVQEAGKGDLELRQKSIDGLVKPIREALSQVDVRIQDLEKQRVDAYAGLTKQVQLLMGEQGELRRETGKLVTALRRPTARGRWGEIQLKRVVELAGMLDHCDFTEQTSVTTEDGRLRPDMVVRLPGGKNLVVDSKAPLEAYLNAQEAPEEEARGQFMKTHARQIRDHLAKLGQKAYWEHLKPTPEFVVMFLPGEIFFSSALEQDPALIEEGVKQKVIVASPTTLIALLRAVYYGWQQEKVAKNAQLISDSGRKLYKHVVVMAEHFARVGKGLSGAVTAYNSSVKTMESGVLGQSRKLKELAAKEEKELPPLEPLETFPRELPPAEE
jgi:DNA recombination protein RmuC